MDAYSSQALLLVDGYNIIGAWQSLKKIRDNDGLEFARHALVETLVNYTSYKGLEAKVVFDSHYQNTPSYEEKHTAKLWIHYTAYAETADTYIERFCASFPRRNPPPHSRLIVATSDQAQRHTVVGYGAEWLSAQKFAKEVDTTKNIRKKSYRPQQNSHKRFLVNSLDSKTQQTLAQWRKGIITD
jgi:predicted RNA-binding protein with PIN domain